MKGLAEMWKTNKVFKWASIVVLVIIVLSIFTYFGSGVPTPTE